MHCEHEWFWDSLSTERVSFAAVDRDHGQAGESHNYRSRLLMRTEKRTFRKGKWTAEGQDRQLLDSEDPDRPALGNLGILTRELSIQPGLHGAGIDSPARLYGDVLFAVDHEG